MSGLAALETIVAPVASGAEQLVSWGIASLSDKIVGLGGGPIDQRLAKDRCSWNGGRKGSTRGRETCQNDDLIAIHLQYCIYPEHVATTNVIS